VRNTVVIALVLTVVTVTGSSAMVIRHDKSDADALQLGARFDAAGEVLPDGGGALIAPTWVLTAAHVAAPLVKGGSVRFAGATYAVTRAIIHPEGALRPDAPPEVDLALLQLAAPVTGITPFALYRDRDELGQVLFIVGYGDFARAGTPWVRTDQRRRAVTNRVNDAGPRRLFMLFDTPEQQATELEGIGDSGGPAVMERGGTRYVAGISSGSIGKPGQYGATDVYTRVSSYVDWIEKAMLPRLRTAAAQRAGIDTSRDITRSLRTSTTVAVRPGASRNPCASITPRVG